MKTDTEYLRGLSENQNLPTLMRDTLRNAAAEIERLREWGNMFRNAVTVEVKSAGTDEEGNCRIIAFSTPLELAKGPSLVFKRAKLVLQPNGQAQRQEAYRADCPLERDVGRRLAKK